MGRSPELLANLPLARTAVDRAAERRADPDLVPRLLAEPATRVLAVRDGSAEVSLDGSRPALVLRPPLPQDRHTLGVFLGVDGDGTAYVAVDHHAADGGDAGDLRTLRQVGADLDDRDAGLLTTALGLLNWHRSHTHCPRCGTPTVPALAGWLRRCPDDGSEHYPRTDPAVIMSVVDEQERILLARGPQWGARRYSVLAGFVEPGETLEAAVAREVYEEVGLRVTDVRFLGDQPWPFPSSLMLGFTARAVGSELSLQEDEIAEARWFTRDQLLREVARGESGVSHRLSIARALIEHWLGQPVPERP
ncbi:MAG TPA: NAD(+) diphosphatase [Pedococcus sp.]|uniref:NAD(+) diphosphatase n=1 Tax=Pedococcus sp. TaxID=2860345 RepID=UPI002F955A63